MKKTIIAIILIILIAGCIGNENPNKNQKFYAGNYRNFRANLDYAENITVSPNEDAIRQILLSNFVERIHVLYIPEEAENSFYLASTFEISNKLTLIYRFNFQENMDIDVYTDEFDFTCLVFFSRFESGAFINRCFGSAPIDDIQEAYDIADEANPVVLLLGPSQTNRTGIFIKDYVIRLEGKDFSEEDRLWTDLDLSVAKMILELMETNN